MRQEFILDHGTMRLFSRVCSLRGFSQYFFWISTDCSWHEENLDRNLRFAIVFGILATIHAHFREVLRSKIRGAMIQTAT